MTPVVTPKSAYTGPIWNSDDLLIRAFRGQPFDEAAVAARDVESHWDAQRDSPLNLQFDQPSLRCLEGDSERFESLSVVRSNPASMRQLAGFAARNRSTWALDVIADRVTGSRDDWASLRAAVLRFSNHADDYQPSLDRVSLDALWTIAEALHARGTDQPAEQGLLHYIGSRVLAGGELAEDSLVAFLENLILTGHGTTARALLPRLREETWIRHALAVDLEHPRFGGSYEALLSGLNEAYRRFGLEPIKLSSVGQTPFERLSTAEVVPHSDGPLVSVIMTTFSPGPATLSAVHSVLNQTHGNLELIITDDASPAEFDQFLNDIEALDSRIRVIRNSENAGTYVRRNEALQLASGEFVTMQDSDDWAHPRRVEIQVRDLLSSPESLANLVRAARVTDDLALVSHRGARLALSEPSILFRRQPVLRAAGYFDTTRKGADTEFRQRLELATGLPVRTVGPEIPLMFMLSDRSSLSGGDFGKSFWTAPERVAYRSSYRRYHEQIRSGLTDAKLPFPQLARRILSPAKLLGLAASQRHFDVLVVVDGHRVSTRSTFLTTICNEIRLASASGLSVAVLQSDSPSGVKNAGPWAEALQALVDSGQVTRIFDDDPVRTPVVVVRHAGAAQGHLHRRLPVETDRIVIVEDASGDDARGVTVAKPDVVATVSSWFDKPPEWVIAQPAPPAPTFVSAIASSDGENLVIALVTSETAPATSFRLYGSRTVDASAEAFDDEVTTATFSMADLPAGHLVLTAVSAPSSGRELVRTIPVDPHTVLTARAPWVVMATDTRGLRLLQTKSTSGAPANDDDLVQRHLTASLTQAEIFRDELALTVDHAPETSLLAVYAARTFRGGTIRRFGLTVRDEQRNTLSVSRSVAELADSRWKIYGRFATPLGTANVPLHLLPHAHTQGSPEFDLRNITSNGFDILHIAPKPAPSLPTRTPTLSIVMPVYNVAEYLETSIQSVLGQAFEDLELIVVDDASTDSSRQIIDMYASIDPRIRPIKLDHNTLGGAGEPSNIGIRAARGKYIAFVDSDDWATSGAFTKLLSLAEEQQAEIVIGDFRTFDDKTREISDSYDSRIWRQIPLNKLISVRTHPSLLRLSAVPWRKLYLREFLVKNDLLFPEGDYFYEDNPLHWGVLTRAERVVATDEIISFHRMAREGQTMSASRYKLGAFVNHANTIVNSLASIPEPLRSTLIEEFFEYLGRMRWTIKHQTQDSARAMIKHGLLNSFAKARGLSPAAHVPERIAREFNGYHHSYPVTDVTVVIPVFNNGDDLRQSLESVLELDQISYDVLLIDDGSEDDSLSIMQEYARRHRHVHVFSQGNRGAGRARNSAIPLVCGRYVFFLDADDVLHPAGLRTAVAEADETGADLMIMKYRIDHVDRGRTHGLFSSDAEIWKQVPTASSVSERRRVAAALINYPWNRLLRTSVLHDSNIFFGSTSVHNDVLFHWHSVLSADDIRFLDVEVATHRKFTTRSQVTNIKDERRMEVLEALRGTYERISQLSTYDAVEDEWMTFSQRLLDWAHDLIPPTLTDEYGRRSLALVARMTAGDVSGAPLGRSHSG